MTTNFLERFPALEHLEVLIQEGEIPPQSFTIIDPKKLHPIPRICSDAPICRLLGTYCFTPECPRDITR